jgi:hypothetical protein
MLLYYGNQILTFLFFGIYSCTSDVPECAGHKQEKPEDFSDLYSLAKIGSKALETVNGASYLIGSIPDLLYIASGTSTSVAF